MKAVTWQGVRDVRVEEVPDPFVEAPTDAVIRVRSRPRGGMADPIPMLTLFDKQIQLRMGQCNIKRWIDDIMPLLGDDDPLGCDTFATHRVPLSQAPEMYKAFPQKTDGAIKVQLKPELS